MNNIIDFPKIKQLQEELNKLLESNPERREYQEWLNKQLDKYGDGSTPESRHNRMLFFNELLKDKIRSLNKALLDCKVDLEKIKTKIKDIENDSK
ncbi:MAG TPA: hypothetical protein VI911_07290 [Patescibacteria group bacterium]|nr:hypothetical protein [Patescibacteria group bacterium]